MNSALVFPILFLFFTFAEVVYLVPLQTVFSGRKHFALFLLYIIHQNKITFY